MFRKMRRIKQQITEDECIRILKENLRGVLSMIGDDGYPYGIPLNHFYSEDDEMLYFHCAKTKHKLEREDLRCCSELLHLTERL